MGSEGRVELVAPPPVPLDAVRRAREAVFSAGAGVSGCGDPAALVDLLRALEDLKSMASAVQARAALQLDALTRAAEAADGVPTERRGRSVAHQVALARRESPHRGRTLLGAARAWAAEMPHTLAALDLGALSEWRAVLLVRETACLPVDARREVDRRVCADQGSLAGLGTARLVALARSYAARLDPAALVERARRAESERAVWIRPAPDTMSYVTALLPVAQGVGVYAALTARADAARAAGDGRSRGQVMADTLVERATGRATATNQPVTVNLVMSDATLLGAGNEAGFVDGFGPVPAQVARNLVAAGLDADAAWLRRLYADPGGALVATTSSSRLHAPGLSALLRARDQGLCRTPYCDAPIRHDDHVVPVASGGVTDLTNSQGLCEACNYAKQSPGWQQAARAGPGRHTVTTVTPTGHHDRSVAPAPPEPAAPARRLSAPSVVDLAFAAVLRAA